MNSAQSLSTQSEMITVAPGGIVSESLTLSFIEDAGKQRTASNGDLFNQSSGFGGNWKHGTDTALMKMGDEVELCFNLSPRAMAARNQSEIALCAGFHEAVNVVGRIADLPKRPCAAEPQLDGGIRKSPANT